VARPKQQVQIRLVPVDHPVFSHGTIDDANALDATKIKAY
jgi:hypothetical protein